MDKNARVQDKAKMFHLPYHEGNEKIFEEMRGLGSKGLAWELCPKYMMVYSEYFKYRLVGLRDSAESHS